MIERSTRFPSRRKGQRRPKRFHAMVERLDARRLMAAGVTGMVSAISGSAGFPLATYEPLDSFLPGRPGSGPLGPLAPAGTPIPLVTLTSSTGTLSSTGYSGTVDWGDGSATDTILFGDFVNRFSGQQPPNILIVDGPAHVYKTPGTYPVTISVNEPGDSTPTVFNASAVVSLTVAGHLNPASDSGYFNLDSVTAVTTPDFVGTTEPGSTVVLTATTAGTNLSVVVGTGVANASGAWSITTVPFVDGLYMVTAKATDPSGNTATGTIAGRQSIFSTNYLMVDASGPKITSYRVTNAKTGAFQVGFSDPSGVFIGPLTDPATYTLTRTSPTPRRGQTFPVSNLTLTAADTSSIGYAPPIATSATVTGTLSGGKPLANGVYTLTVRSAGIISLSGASLDGKYAGKFPTGGVQPGGDFQVRFTVLNGKASGPIAIAPAKTTTHTVKAKVAARLHA